MDEAALLDEFEPMLRLSAAAAYMRADRVMSSRWADFDDYLQDARIIALDAIRRYDPSRTDADLQTFVGGTVKRRLVDRTRAYLGAGQGRASMPALHRSVDDTAADLLSDGLSAEDIVPVNANMALARLPRRERHALRGRIAGMTLAETARAIRTKKLRPAELDHARAQLRAEIL